MKSFLRICFFSFSFFASLFLVANFASAEVNPASPFGDHMVLQQGQPVPVWGTATPGELVKVRFAGQSIKTQADENGQWRLSLSPLNANAKPAVMTIGGSETEDEIKLKDVLVGEVWICGGQSNMERQLGLRAGQQPIVGWEPEVAGADYPLIRQLYVTQHLSASPEIEGDMAWSVCSPETVVNFTAVGYFFARDLHLAKGVPVGIIHSSWGGTKAEAWTSEEGLKDFSEFKESLEFVKDMETSLFRAQEVYHEKLAAWMDKYASAASATPAWQSVGLDDSEWKTMNLPVLWEDAGHPGYDGIGWYRKHFDLPAGWKGQDLEIHLGPIDDIDTTWCNGEKIGETYFYITKRVYTIPARLLKKKNNVIAVRILDTGGGGGIWDASIPRFVLPVGGDEMDSLSLNGPWLYRFSVSMDEIDEWPPAYPSSNANNPTVLFNGMIAPLIPYAVKGATFYQGESNADRPALYQRLFPAMIGDWRRLWKQGDFPFLFVQIAPYNGQPPEIREAQLIAWQNTKNTAMAVTIDVGDAEDIHPAQKEPVGERLALAARALAYGETIEYSGPVYSKIEITEDRATLYFTHIGEGLVVPGGELEGFVIAGEDGVFHPARATIAGDTVVVNSPAVKKPKAVRYGWENVARGNLFNRAGLPASPFRTDL